MVVFLDLKGMVSISKYQCYVCLLCLENSNAHTNWKSYSQYLNTWKQLYHLSLKTTLKTFNFRGTNEDLVLIDLILTKSLWYIFMKRIEFIDILTWVCNMSTSDANWSFVYNWPSATCLQQWTNEHLLKIPCLSWHYFNKYL